MWWYIPSPFPTHTLCACVGSFFLEEKNAFRVQKRFNIYTSFSLGMRLWLKSYKYISTSPHTLHAQNTHLRHPLQKRTHGEYQSRMHLSFYIDVGRENGKPRRTWVFRCQRKPLRLLPFGDFFRTAIPRSIFFRPGASVRVTLKYLKRHPPHTHGGKGRRGGGLKARPPFALAQKIGVAFWNQKLD